jgi:hypothetical protein
VFLGLFDMKGLCVFFRTVWGLLGTFLREKVFFVQQLAEIGQSSAAGKY